MKKRDKILASCPVFYTLVSAAMMHKFGVNLEQHSVIVVGVSIVLGFLATEVTRQGIDFFSSDNNNEEDE